VLHGTAAVGFGDGQFASATTVAAPTGPATHVTERVMVPPPHDSEHAPPPFQSATSHRASVTHG